MWEPVGPLAPSVYWRRRSVALGVAVLLLAGFVWALAGLSAAEPDAATVEARARAAAMQGPAETSGSEGSGPSDVPPDVAPGGSGNGGAPGPIAAALPSVIPPGDAPGLAPTPAAGGALLVPPGGEDFRGFLPPGVPAGSSGPLLDAPTTPAATPQQPAAAAPETSPSETPAPAARSAPAPGPCADGDIRVTARTDATSYPAGRKPALSLVVTNTGSAPCVRDLDAAKQAVAVVRTPGDGLWGSNDCSPGDTDDVRTLAPGEEAVFTVRWSGRTSTPGCAGERTTVPPGTYQLLARLDEIVSDPVSFTLAG
ncbi:DUF4232 domain-containing protein [Actinomycetospora aeridis]|uniref:DUF4232 domain-containing protein n=1 Tax=Actinomycetospora aeridis TaxID=3129231 RepID=A0ABU8N0Y0_9PSEU